MYVLDKLWQEGLSPNEKYTRKGSEYHKILQRICEEGDKVSEELTEKGKKQLAEETQQWRAYEHAINAVLSMG